MIGAKGAAPEAASELVHRLFVLIKAASVYGPENAGYRTHADAARATMEELFARAPALRLEAREEFLFFNESPIHLRPGDAGGRFLCAELKRRGVGTVEFRVEGGAKDLDAFIFAFHKTAKTEKGALDELRRLLKAAGARSITLFPPDEGDDEDDGGPAAAGSGKEAAGPGTASAPPEPATPATAARRTFLQAVGTVEELMNSVRNGRDADLGPARRAVEGLAEQVIADSQALFELSLLMRFDEYTYAHCVNVCVYSITIGERLGLGWDRLSELGFGALFHDVGKAKLPRELIDKPDEFTDEEWILMRRHPALGAKALLEMRRPHDAVLARAVSMAFEHHLGLTGKGYPVLVRPRRQDLFSRICAVADAFDAMTSGRVYAKRALSPDEALRRMVQAAGTAFDPLLLRIFINAAGIYPIGTALLLDTGERGVVSRNAPDDLLHPQVVVFTDRDGAKTPARLVDLGRPKAGAPPRAIRGTLDPRKQDIDAGAVLRERAAGEPPPPALAE
ncbi:MAG: HD-GYP domain-containing protein [Elusimicrobiota bacterium]